MLSFCFPPSPLVSFPAYPSTPPSTEVNIEYIENPGTHSKTHLFPKEAQNFLISKEKQIQSITSLSIVDTWKEQSRTTYDYDIQSDKYPLSPLLAIVVIQEAQTGSIETIVDRAFKRFANPTLDKQLQKELNPSPPPIKKVVINKIERSNSWEKEWDNCSEN